MRADPARRERLNKSAAQKEYRLTQKDLSVREGGPRGAEGGSESHKEGSPCRNPGCGLGIVVVIATNTFLRRVVSMLLVHGRRRS